MLSKHIDHTVWEDKWRTLWKKYNAFSTQGSLPQKTMVLPPPNVTGRLHLGHAMNGTLQDVMARYWRLKGHDVLWQGGVDHAGIATQMMVEKHLATQGIQKKTLGKEKFIDKVWEWKATYGHLITQQLEALGFSLNGPGLRFTMDPAFLSTVRHAFIHFYKKGWIYRAQRLINWDTALETAVSDLEVTHRQEKGSIWTLQYATDDPNTPFLSVATTRPETIFGDQALAVHPQDARYASLVGKQACIPWENRWIPIIADPLADPDKGTGVVKITPSHDFNDAEVAQRHALSHRIIFDATGHMLPCVPPELVGLSVKQAQDKVLAWCKDHNILLQEDTITHAVPYSQRSGTVIEPRLTWQWYMDVKPMAQQVLAHRPAFQWHPASYEKIFQDWLSHIQPWCLSRQLWWGHPIPVWYGKDGHTFVALTQDEALAQAKAHYNRDDVVLTADEDVLDTWFSSGFWPLVTLGWPNNTPPTTDLLVTGPDIIFFWVARMSMMGKEFTQSLPFHHVMVHPLIRDAEGKKMSKTTGNVVDPLEVIKTKGTDALRFALVSLAAPAQAVKFTPEVLDRGRHFATKLWNLARFFYDNTLIDRTFFKNTLHNSTVFSCDIDALNAFDQWILAEWQSFMQRIHGHFDTFSLAKALEDMTHFIWHYVCDRYVESIKFSRTMHAVSSRVTTFLFQEILKLIHPFMPFITEELWHHVTHMPQNSFLMQQRWCALNTSQVLMERSQVQDVQAVWEVIHTVRSIQGMIQHYKHPLALRLNLVQGTHIWKHRFQTYTPFIAQQCHLFWEANTQSGGKMKFFVQDQALEIEFSQGHDLPKIQTLLAETLKKEEKVYTAAKNRLMCENFQRKATEDVIKDMTDRANLCEKRIKNIESWLQGLA